MRVNLLVIVLMLSNISCVFSGRGRSPAERRIRSRQRKANEDMPPSLNNFLSAISSGDDARVVKVIKRIPDEVRQNYLKCIDPQGRRALALAQNPKIKNILLAYGAQPKNGENRTGIVHVRSCPNIKEMCQGATSPRALEAAAS